MTQHNTPTMAELQEANYGEARDYTAGSPHLAHGHLRARIENDLVRLVGEQIDRTGACRVVEVGAGHGTFTAALAAAGATVSVTEMSAPSAEVIRERFRHQDAVDVVYDPEGTRCAEVVAAGCDLLVFVSVLHHIPDYLGVVGALAENLAEGGALYTVQDPLWYPRRSRWDMTLDRGAYFAWRIASGHEVVRGLKTRVRRVRGEYDETSESDMVEYHVMRQGVDEEALAGVLRPLFAQVELHAYWSTQSALLQGWGERFGLRSTFGVTARSRRG